MSLKDTEEFARTLPLLNELECAPSPSFNAFLFQDLTSRPQFDRRKDADDVQRLKIRPPYFDGMTVPFEHHADAYPFSQRIERFYVDDWANSG